MTRKPKTRKKSKPAGKTSSTTPRKRKFVATTLLPLALAVGSALVPTTPSAAPPAASRTAAVTAPAPLLQKGHPVDWWFVFKLNSTFPECGGTTRECRFGGEVQDYNKFGQQFVFASSENETLQQGSGCAGDTLDDPLGATFDEVYTNSFHYVIWNDQFYDDPDIQGCSESCGAPWGHSKGLLAWNDAGEGMVMQVTTPSWPASGSNNFPRKSDGNTLGCVKDNNVLVSQHFFALKLTKDDVTQVLTALKNSSVVTDVKNPQIVDNGGPTDIQSLVSSLGVKSTSQTVTSVKLSSGIRLISKPSKLHVPAWQLVSSVLGGVDLRTATWWASPEVGSTTASTTIACWDSTLAKPGAVDIATSGTWAGKKFGLTGAAGANFNHAKIGVSTTAANHYTIFGDMNQQGTLSGNNCASSQNGRGGTFYVVDDPKLEASVADLISGDSAPLDTR